MKTNELKNIIERLEREIQYLYIDFKRLLNQSETFEEVTFLKNKIKHAEESLRLNKKMLNYCFN